MNAAEKMHLRSQFEVHLQWRQIVVTPRQLSSTSTTGGRPACLTIRRHFAHTETKKKCLSVEADKLTANRHRIINLLPKVSSVG